MAELRYNPLLDDWTMVAADRQRRPARPRGECPFCPGSGKVPREFEVYTYPNDFPVLSVDAVDPDARGVGGPYRAQAAYGRCEVILYSSAHEETLAELPMAHIEKLIDLWIDRMAALADDDRHRYIMIFENRGAEVGATMPHPHGQIYAFPYVPLKIRRELTQAQKYYESQHRCLICDITLQEEQSGARMLAKANFWSSYIPYFTDYPYGAFITARAHRPSLLDLDASERRGLAEMLKWVTTGFDRLYDKPMPYMMSLHQSPVNQAVPADDFYHFHIEFYPPLYAADKIKYLAASEVGAWASANPTSVEETAPILRRAMQQGRSEAGW